MIHNQPRPPNPCTIAVAREKKEINEKGELEKRDWIRLEREAWGKRRAECREVRISQKKKKKGRKVKGKKKERSRERAYLLRLRKEGKKKSKMTNGIANGVRN